MYRFPWRRARTPLVVFVGALVVYRGLGVDWGTSLVGSALIAGIWQPGRSPGPR